MLSASLNIVGSIPDILFAQIGKLTLKKNKSTYEDYLKSLSFYQGLSKIKKNKPFFILPDTAPAFTQKTKTKIANGHKIVFKFSSRYEVKNPLLKPRFNAFLKNKTSYINLWQHDQNTKPPLVLCLHGFMLGSPKVAEKMFRIDKLYNKGVDVALYTLPHHGDRVKNFYEQKLLNPHDIPLTIEGMAQAMHDLHSTILALKKMGYKKIGLIGASLGGMLSALYLTQSKLPEFVFAVVPAVKLHSFLMPKSRHFDFPITSELKTKTKDILDLMTPENYKPKIDASKICVVLHKGDKINRARLTKRWIERWEIKNVIEVYGGHWFYFDKKIRGKTWYTWLQDFKFIKA